ncbi:MAG: PEP-utilizing enzyme [Gemmatimonadota bacterium]
MTDAFHVITTTPWTRQGEWGGTTLSRALTYAGMQRSLPEWTGVREGYENFLHSGETTYIATGQYERFARAYLCVLERERTPLKLFTDRFERLLDEVRGFHATLAEDRHHGEKIARYVHLHQQMQPYSYVFGYGEDQVVGTLLDRLLVEADLDPGARELVRASATSPLNDERASAQLARARRDGVDARAMDFADLVRRQLQVRTDRRILWNKVEEAMRPHFAHRAGKSVLPVRLLMEATPQEVVGSLPVRSVLESRIGTTFLAHATEVHLLTGEPHLHVQRHLSSRLSEPRPERLEGNCAYPGIVRGRVRIVTTTEQADALLKGEILVSDMTTPELTTACSRAAAIVTDRGGILCHAALVAREMRIPTVLGTEHATSVLQDGDLIEVDAERGIVRLITIEAPS